MHIYIWPLEADKEQSQNNVQTDWSVFCPKIMKSYINVTSIKENRNGEIKKSFYLKKWAACCNYNAFRRRPFLETTISTTVNTTLQQQ